MSQFNYIVSYQELQKGDSLMSKDGSHKAIFQVSKKRLMNESYFRFLHLISLAYHFLKGLTSNLKYTFQSR